MSELHRRLTNASEQLVSRWNPERAEAAWRGVQRRQQHATRQRAVGAGAIVLTILLGVVLWSVPHAKPLAATTPASPAESPLLVLEDRTEVTGLTDDTQITELERSEEVTRLRLEQGAARFRVTHREDRVFEVVAADVTATVLGTVFTVRLQPAAVLLSVESGRVRLRWPEGEVEVGAGEKHLVPRQRSESRAASEPTPSATPPSPPAPRARVTPTWRELAERGEYEAAYDRLTSVGPSAVRDEPGDLLLAADVTRLGGHPGEAVTWLTRVVNGHAADSRAALAAFTLGRVYLDQLGRPHQAAEAFARARQMAPGGALAEDALAREVEARARSGDASGARRLAERYVARYPSGRRTASVRRHGGLDAAE